MRVFLDTNILLDVLLNRPQFLAASAAVIARCEALGATMFIAWHGLATAYYLLKRGRTEAETLVDRGDWPTAETRAREALALSEAVGRQLVIASNCNRLAKALARQGKPRRRIAYAKRSVDLYTRLRPLRLAESLSTLRECGADFSPKWWAG